MDQQIIQAASSRHVSRRCVGIAGTVIAASRKYTAFCLSSVTDGGYAMLYNLCVQ